MTVYLVGKWELGNGQSQMTGSSVSLRHYCDVTNPTSLHVTNYNNAWKTDGSDIGLSTSYELANAPGSFSASLAGSIYSGNLYFPVTNFPLIPTGPVYPIVVSTTNGWKYAPVDPNLTKSLALTGMNAGFITDADIEVVVRSTSAAATYMRATITDLEYDDDWNTLWLDETIGSGDASTMQINVGGTGSSQRYVDAVCFATTYSATWRTILHSSGTNGSQRHGIGAFRIDASVGAGSYKLSTLLQSGLATTIDGYLHMSESGPHYEIK